MTEQQESLPEKRNVEKIGRTFFAFLEKRGIGHHVEGDFEKMTNLAKSFRTKLTELAEVRAPVPIAEKNSARSEEHTSELQSH